MKKRNRERMQNVDVEASTRELWKSRGIEESRMMKGEAIPLYHDQREETEDFRLIEDAVDREATIMADAFFHVDDALHRPRVWRYTFWSCKKQILRKKYRIDWYSPADCNPMIDFDSALSVD